MTQDEFDSIAKPRVEWRNWRERPITDEEIASVLSPIREHRKRERGADRWTPAKESLLRRPMDI